MPDAIGLIGLGRMGRNLAANMIEHDIAVQAWDRSSNVLNKVRTLLPGIPLSANIEELIEALPTPRCVMLMVPSGDAVEQCLMSLSGLLGQGDIIIDSGNSHFRDTERRQERLSSQGIHLLGLGISGGLDGARFGPSIMAGGPIEAWRQAGPIFETISARAGDAPCAGYIGEGGAGHFVKMVHNGIEYAIMQILADVFELLSQGCKMPPEEIAKTFHALSSGVTAGFLVETSAHVAAAKNETGTGFLIDTVDDRADQTGTGYWAVETAFNLGIAVPTIAAAVQFRAFSAEDRFRNAAIEDGNEGTHFPSLQPNDVIPLIGPGVACAMASAFAQGFSLMGAAKDNFGGRIDRHLIARLWCSGCILRGEMVNRIADNQGPEPESFDLLRSDSLRPLVAEGIEPLRDLLKAALSSGLPVPGLASAGGYIDASSQSQLSTRFIQLQRDYFGYHGFRRTGQDGLVHGPWHRGDDP
jgi:6-phosphogluconate dehydrogenase